MSGEKSGGGGVNQNKQTFLFDRVATSCEPNARKSSFGPDILNKLHANAGSLYHEYKY